MGILTVKCPNCDNSILFTSGYGGDYKFSVGDIQFEMAADLDRAEEQCENCGKLIILEAEIQAYMWVNIKGESSSEG